MLQVVVEIEPGFLWSYKGFYVSYKVFYGEENPSRDQSNSTICDKYDLKLFNLNKKASRTTQTMCCGMIEHITNTR